MINSEKIHVDDCKQQLCGFHERQLGEEGVSFLFSPPHRSSLRIHDWKYIFSEVVRSLIIKQWRLQFVQNKWRETHVEEDASFLQRAPVNVFSAVGGFIKFPLGELAESRAR